MKIYENVYYVSREPYNSLNNVPTDTQEFKYVWIQDVNRDKLGLYLLQSIRMAVQIVGQVYLF